MRLILATLEPWTVLDIDGARISLKTLSQIVSLGKPEVMLARYRQILLVLRKYVFWFKHSVFLGGLLIQV